ncbi:hypothetical protein AcW1_009430 [Taiwanofungus camphoratus]|nr:hypothetical protein AcW1_009430 [Antrodia cinnamomea]
MELILKADKDRRIGTWQPTSVRLLNQPDEAAEIPDELESFFHVLFYAAVRYLRHNCTDIGAFIKSKWQAMRHGETSAGKQGIPPRFLDDEDSHKHPLNGLLSKLLYLLRARYNVLASDGEFTSIFDDEDIAQSFREDAEDETDRLEFAGAQDEENLDSDSSSDDSSIVQRENTVLETDRAAANRLKTHNKMIERLRKYALHRKWPNKDRMPDQLPPRYNYGQVVYRGTKRASVDTAARTSREQTMSETRLDYISARLPMKQKLSWRQLRTCDDFDQCL